MGSEIDTTSSFWKRYFTSEEDARKIDNFDTVASFKKPNDEFRSRRLQIMESLFEIDSQAVAKPKKESLLIAETLSKNVIHDCEEEACKDEIYTVERPKKFGNLLEKELDDYAQLIGFNNVNVPDKKRKAEVSEGCRSRTKIEADKKRKAEVSEGCRSRTKIEADKKRKAEVSEGCRSRTKIEADKKRKVEEKNEKRVVDSYDLKFEVSKRRFEEKNKEIEKSKKKVQILDMKDIVPPPQKSGRNGKTKRGFGSRMKKILKKL
ncbi:Uncharacterized protein Adt_15194 [Abeliophyllum distichum]|uniref:Uncharacterized protein n=1 Tax=Abeliophyllum distichum TaxID=126358 RepID=A0ABD1U1T7_9LAMI